MEEAKSDLKKIENLRKVKEAEEKRKKQMEEKLAKNKESATGKEDGEEDGGAGWRTQAKPIVPQREEAPRRARDEDNDGFLSRSVLGTKKADETSSKPEAAAASGRPTFTRQKKADDNESGFMSRSAMGQKKEEEKKEAPKKVDEKSSFGGWRGATGAQKTDNKDTGVKRGGPAPTGGDQKKKEEKEDGGGWSMSGGARRTGGGGFNLRK